MTATEAASTPAWADPDAATVAWRARVDDRLDTLTADVGRLNTRLDRMEARFDSTLPHLATKADVAQLHANMERAINALTWKLTAILVAGGAALAAFLRWLAG